MSYPIKQCSKCKEFMELDQFYKRVDRKDQFSSYCVICYKKYKTVYRVKKKKEISIQSTYYYKKNREKTLAKQKAHRVKNRAVRLIYEIEYRDKNKNNINAKISEWKSKNPGKVKSYKAKRRATEINATPNWLKKEHWEQIEKIYAECHRLTKEIGIPHHVDHIFPLQAINELGERIGSGLHVPWNLRIVPASQNCSDGALLKDKS